MNFCLLLQQVNSTQADAIPGVDITPQSGIVVFQAGEAQTYLFVQIKDDNVNILLYVIF